MKKIIMMMVLIGLLFAENNETEKTDLGTSAATVILFPFAIITYGVEATGAAIGASFNFLVEKIKK